MVFTLSSLAESMNEQVLTISTSASAGSDVISIPASCMWPIMISESIKFLAQPSEMRPTLVDVWVGVDTVLEKPRQRGEEYP